jgi:hypothetical protein
MEATKRAAVPVTASISVCPANVRVPGIHTQGEYMEISACIRDRFPTRGSREALSLSASRLIDSSNMPSYPSNPVRRPCFDAESKVRRTKKSDIFARKCG